MPKRSVLIIKKEDENVVSVEEINLDGLNYDPNDEEFFDLAWQNVVEDKLVNNEDRDKHIIRFND